MKLSKKAHSLSDIKLRATPTSNAEVSLIHSRQRTEIPFVNAP